MPNFPPKLRNYMVEAVVESLGHVDPSRPFVAASAPEDDAALLRLPLTAVIEFTGDRIKGALTVACGADFLKVTNPIKHVPKGKEDQYGRDWLGETINLILGALKRKLANHGVPFKISTPIFGHYTATTAMVLERFGDGQYGDEGYVADFWFECNKHPCCFQLALTSAESFA